MGCNQILRLQPICGLQLEATYASMPDSELAVGCGFEPPQKIWSKLYLYFDGVKYTQLKKSVVNFDH